MKLRLLPVIMAILASAIVLFGGWYVYRNVAMENPLEHVFDQAEGVQDVQTQLTKDQVTINLKLSPSADVRDLYSKLTTQTASLIGKRDVKLNIESSTSPELEKWWASALFDVAQAMDTKQYSKIPQTLQARASLLPGMKVVTEMDDNNVYVHLTNGENSKYVILPRTPEKMGVWPNE